jgi:large subunit ribosomal protein L22
MGKPKHARALEHHEAQAILSNVRVSPRKLNLVAAMIRNMPAQRAIATLTFSKRRIAHQVRKTLESAIANAENNHQLDVDKLVVARAEVGRAVVMRRFHARGRGRSARIEKWFSHMKIVVAERDDAEAASLVTRAEPLVTRAEPPPPALTSTLPALTSTPPALTPPPVDHAGTDTMLSVPETEATEAEAAEQAMSADAVAADTESREHGAAAPDPTAPEGSDDHANTDAALSVPETEGTEAEAAQQSMSDDAAHKSDSDDAAHKSDEGAA